MVPEDVRARGLLAGGHPSDSTVLYNAAYTYGVPEKRQKLWGCCAARKPRDTPMRIESTTIWTWRASMTTRNSAACIRRLRRNKQAIAAKENSTATS
jgi:hypothetical protein